MALIKALVLSALIFFLNFAYAIENPSLEGLTIDDALRSALIHPNIEGKKRDLEGSRQRLDTSKWLRFPSVSIISSAAQSSVNTPGATVVTTVRVEQPIWTGGRISGSIKSSTAKLSSAESAVLEIEQELIIKTATAFINYLKYQQKLEASKENIFEHQRLLELIERRARNEISPMNEIVLAKARLEQAKTENIQIQTQAANAKADLENFTGQKISKLIIPRFDLSMPENISEAVNMMLDYSPLLKRLAYDVDASEGDIEASKAAVWPQLSARSDENFGGVLQGNVTYLALTYAPGNGLAAISGIKEAEAKKESAKTAILSSRSDLINKLNTDWNQYKSETNQIEVLSNLSETTRGIYQSYVRQYSAGKKTWIEVLNAKKEATQSKYSLAEAEWNSFITGLRIQASTGILNSMNIGLR